MEHIGLKTVHGRSHITHFYVVLPFIHPTSSPPVLGPVTTIALWEVED
jgi:hypothetical protein